MGYIKGGIVTRIDVLSNTKKVNKFLNDNFDLSMFNFKNNSYLLDEKLLKENFWKFREEYLELIDHTCDSIKNSESFIIEENINKLKMSKISLINNNKSYYFDDYKEYIFETDIDLSYKNIRIYFISIYWDVNKIIADDFSNLTKLVNNLTRKSLKNPLKKVSWLTVI